MATEARTIRVSRARIARATVPRRLVALWGAHPVWATFVLAVAVRAIAAVALAILHPNKIAPDGVQYSNLAADAANGHTAGWSTWDHWLYLHVGVILRPLTVLYEVFGAHQIVGQLYVALLGAGTAAVTTRLAMEVLPRRWAIVAGLIVALLPSQIIWSSLILKDPGVWLVLAGLALTVAVAGRSRGVRLLALGLVAVALLVLLEYLRPYAVVIAAWALMLAAVLGPRPQRLKRTAGAVAIGVLLPWLAFNMGPAGLTYVKGAPAPTQLRANMAVGAKSAIPGSASSSSSTSPGSPATQSEVSADLKHLPPGVLAMLAEPYPWQSDGSIYVNLARVQDIVWYPLVLLAFVGLLTVRPRHLRVMAFPLLVGGASLITYALTEGNIGTAFRQRGEFEWVIAMLVGFGLWRLLERRTARPEASPSEPTPERQPRALASVASD
jgi:hypothetical protein